MTGDVTPENMALSVAVQYGLQKDDVLLAYSLFAVFTSQTARNYGAPDFAEVAPEILQEALDGIDVETAFLFGLWVAAGLWKAAVSGEPIPPPPRIPQEL